MFLITVTNKRTCCIIPSLFHRNNHIADVKTEYNVDALMEEDEVRKEFEIFILNKLEEYSKEKLTYFLHFTSRSYIRRRLRSDIKLFTKKINRSSVIDKTYDQWIQEIFHQIDSHSLNFQTLITHQNEIRNSFTMDKLFALQHMDNNLKVLQLERAKKIFINVEYHDNDELLSDYKDYVLRELTPKKLKDDRINIEKIDLEKEFKKVENFARKHLVELFNNYAKRQYPKLKLIKEMIDLGMKQMIKQPKLSAHDKSSGSSSFLTQTIIILRSKSSYKMALHNLADDFMLLRFGKPLDIENNNSNKFIRKRFIRYIHEFLNTISILLQLLGLNLDKSYSSVFNLFNFDLSQKMILSPHFYVDEWTWLLEKWKIALEIFPINLTNQDAFGRLLRTTIGVGIACLFILSSNDKPDDIDKQLFQALQMGFYYGIAYSIVDGFQDNQDNQQEQINFDELFENAERILCGDRVDSTILPQLPIMPLLLETFHSLAQLTSINETTQETFMNLVLLLRSQRIDKKNLENPSYSNIDVYLGPLLKSHFTYTATAFLGGMKKIDNPNDFWVTPFLGQLTDDCRDMYEDSKQKSMTPVTYYIKHNGLSLNPFLVFLFICEDLYVGSQCESNTGGFLGRRIMRTLRSLGNDFKKFLNIFTLTTYPDLHKYLLSLQSLFSSVSDPEKAVFRRINTFGKSYALNHRTLETFAHDCLPLIENGLLIKFTNNNSLIEGVNYSLKVGGKRLRPLLTFMIAQMYSIDLQRILPLARAIEYLHTSSLIFDDLPAQDNAPLRRGKPTLHMTIETDYNDIPTTLTEGRAQLAAVNLIAYAIESVSVDLRKQNFSCESINQVTAEIAQSMSELCYGQFLDLKYSRAMTHLTIDDLDNVAYLKTGKAIEIAIICPILLAQQNQSLDRYRELSRLMGILFQMKDDLLDVDGNTNELGKLKDTDEKNKTITYIRLLGVEATRERIQNIRKQVELIVNDLWPQAGTIRDLIRYICERRK